MAILTTDDFKNGKYYIPLKGVEQTTDFNEYISRYETTYLSRMFGKELYDLFITDLSGGVPTSSRFIFVFDPFIDQTDNSLTESKGIKEMLKGIIYFQYLRDRVTTVGTDGIHMTRSENSETMNGINHSLISRYNEGIETYNLIQNYMFCIDPDTYPEFDGVNQDFAHGF